MTPDPGRGQQGYRANRDKSLDALRRFYRTHGRGPTARECGAGLDPDRRAELPAYSTLQRQFGSFPEALKAAGLTPRHQGQQIARAAAEAAERARQARSRPFIVDPHWPTILKEAREALARRCA